jgi:uncharacterized protein YcnI
MRRPLLTAGVVAVPLLVLGVVGAGPASAHVVVSSSDAAPGGYGKLEFRVPTESDSAKTVKLIVTLPETAPFGDVSVQTVPGWTVTTTERKLAKPVTTDDGFTLDKAVGTVTWTATAGGVPPGQFEEFDLSVGPFPEQAGQTLTFPVHQTYSDGTVVRWDEPTQAGKPEPEHPAPTLSLAARPNTPSASPASSPAAGAEANAAAVPAAAATATDGTDGTTRNAAIAGLVVAVLALILAAGAFVRARQR